MTLAHLAVAAFAFVAMEGGAWLLHRFVMHRWLWSWHRSHHAPRSGMLERNDRFVVVFALPPIALFWLGSEGCPVAWWAGLGITLYGGAYALFHDGLVHRRWPLPFNPRGGYLGRLVIAHHLHHAVHTRDGCVSFGFLYAPPTYRLRRRLRASREIGQHDAGGRLG